MEAIRAVSGTRDTVAEQPPKAESSSNGAVEHSNKEIEGMILTPQEPDSRHTKG